MGDINEASIKALELLYNTQEGKSFNELNISEQDFLVLYDEKYIEESEGSVFEVNGNKCVVHEGNIHILPNGKTYVESLRRKEADIQKEDKRYRITTRIAYIALFLSVISLILQFVDMAKN